MHDYVALLGRINVGSRRVAMATLRACLEELGHRDVGTYIQTGNLWFRSAEADPGVVETALAAHLGERLGFPVPTFVRRLDALERLADDNPFRGVDVDADIRLLVLFLSGPLPGSVEFPFADDRRGFRLLEASESGELFVVLRLVSGRPGNVVDWVERRYGVAATGRFAHTLAGFLAAARRGVSG